MKKALVMGITGGFGGHVAQALARDGWAIRALLHDASRLPERFSDAEVIEGDAARVEDVREAAAGVDIIVYGINPRNYHWDGIVVPMIDHTAQVAEANGQTIVFPGNVYIFNPDDGPEFSEHSPVHPVSKRGLMRQEMEQRLRLASERGARVIIVRMGDFIAAEAPSTWMRQLIKKTKSGYSLMTAGPRDLTHTWTYLPDAAQATAELVNKRDSLASFSVFHFRGYRISFTDIERTIREATGKEVKLGRFPWLVIRLLAPFSELFRGLVEMRYLWNREINLSDARLRAVINKPLPQTPLANALLESGLIQG